jgi:L-histidine N-alpha-methyltransferase
MPGYTFIDHLPADLSVRTLRADVRMGLTSPRKWLPPKWFYDKVGSELFEEITRLPEYYPTRVEREVLHREADRLILVAGCDTLVELGSGSSNKTRLLLDRDREAAGCRADGQVRRGGGAAYRDLGEVPSRGPDRRVDHRRVHGTGLVDR